MFLNGNICHQGRPILPPEEWAGPFLTLNDLWLAPEFRWKTYVEHVIEGGELDEDVWDIIMKAIPKAWTRQLRLCQEDTDKMDHPWEVAQEHPKPSQVVYKKLVSKIIDKPDVPQRWSKDMGEEVTKEEWLQSVAAGSSLTPTRLRSFFIQFINKSYWTNIVTVHMGLVQSPFCGSCPGVKETVTHAYYECPKIQKLWTHMQAWHNEKFVNAKKIGWTKKNSLLNCHGHIPHTVLSTIIKKHILHCRIDSKEVVPAVVGSTFTMYIHSERIILGRKAQHRKLQSIWGQYLPHI